MTNNNVDEEKLSNLIQNELLQCPICYGQLAEPKTLPECLHTYCKLCLEQLQKKQAENRQLARLDELQTEHRFRYIPTPPIKLICPTCRTPNRVPKDGVQGFPTDFRINKLETFLAKSEINDNEEESLDISQNEVTSQNSISSSQSESQRLAIATENLLRTQMEINQSYQDTRKKIIATANKRVVAIFQERHRLLSQLQEQYLKNHKNFLHQINQLRASVTSIGQNKAPDDKKCDVIKYEFISQSPPKLGMLAKTTYSL